MKILTVILLILFTLPSYANWDVKYKKNFISSCQESAHKSFDANMTKIYCGCVYKGLSEELSKSETQKLMKSGKLATDSRVTPIVVNCQSLIASSEQKEQSCYATADEINENAPFKLDSITSLTRTMCMDGKKLDYYYTIKTGGIGDAITSSVVKKELKNSTMNGACTTPATLSALKFFDLGYIYYTDTNKYIGEFLITLSDCES